MRTISAEATTALAAQDRKVKVRVDVNWTDVFVGSGNVASTLDQNDMCGASTAVQDAVLSHVHDTVVTTPHEYIINDGTWYNDGTQYWAPGTVAEAANNQLGWYSAEVSGVGGAFATSPKLTVNFGEDRAVQLIRVVGEPTLGQYPVDFTVTVYDVLNNVLGTPDVVTGNSSVEYISDFSTDDITDARYIVLTIDTWSDAETVSKIIEFFGVITDTFYGDDIVSCNVLEEMESDNGTSPIGNASCNELTLELQNIELTRSTGDVYEDPYFPDNSASYLNNSITPNNRLTLYYGIVLPNGTTEWILMGTFWSARWDVSEMSFSASVTARDRMEILRKNKFRLDSILIEKNYYEIAEEILNYAKVNIPLNDLTWNLSADLQNYNVPYYGNPEMTYYEALKEIARACNGRVYANRDDEIVIETYEADSVAGSADWTIAKNQCESIDRPIGYTDIKNYVEVPYSTFLPEDEAGEVWTTEDISVGAGDTTVETVISWGDDLVMEATAATTDQSGVTMAITTEAYTPYGATITSTKTGGTSGTFKIVISGKKLLLTAVDKEFDEDEDSIRLYQKSVESLNENLLIQDQAIAAEMATSLLESLKDPRKDITVDINGNPASEIGDIADIEVYSKDSTYDEFRIIRQEFNYDGGLRCLTTARKTINYS